MDSRIKSLLHSAEKSKPSLWIANRLLASAVPFNQSHSISILEVSEYRVKAKLPYKRSNYNHLDGLHACALMALAEYTIGVLFAKNIYSGDYRLIIESMNFEFHYQGRAAAVCEYEISEDWLQQHVFTPLETMESVSVHTEPEVFDVKGNHLLSGSVGWQFKKWESVEETT